MRVNRRLGFSIAVAALVAAVGTASGIVAAIVATADDGYAPVPIAAAPPDEPNVGLVYLGLSPAPKGDVCVGSYRIAGHDACSHGPDQPPPGLDVSRPVPPVVPGATEEVLPVADGAPPAESSILDGAVAGSPAVVADANDGGTAFAVGPNGVVCAGDGVTGKRVHVLYVREAPTASRYAQFLPSFRSWAATADAFYSASATATGGTRHLRYVTTPDCQVAVDEVELPAGALTDFSRSISALKTLGYNRTDRKYMIFAESRVYCGIGTLAGDDRPGTVNRNNGGPSYGRSDSGCWTASVAAHELGHNLGAVQGSAPHATRNGHCWDERDLMCYNDGGVPTPPGTIQQVCTSGDANQVDCNHDDYFHARPPTGSYLASHWNSADNDYFLRDDGGGGPGPTPTATATAGPTATRTAGPSPVPPSPTASPVPPSPTASPAPPSPTVTPTGALKPLQVTDVTSTSARLSWEPAATGTRYGVVVNGRTVGTVRSSRVTLVGLRADTDYRVQITVASRPYTVVVTVHTRPVTRPPAGATVSLTNALTSRVADVFGGRSADGTPIVLYGRHGGANQLWQLEAAGSGAVLLRSKATGKCAAVRGGTVVDGAPVVQAPCATALRWTLVTTPYGLAFTSGGLVLGVGRSRFGDGRLLTLQRPTQSRYQSWMV